MTSRVLAAGRRLGANTRCAWVELIVVRQAGESDCGRGIASASVAPGRPAT